jgi:uncharacterized membrane protein YdbT with pleckstrin-like domain
MAGYVEGTLTSGERILLDTRISLRPYIFRFLLGSIFLIAGLISMAIPGTSSASIVFPILIAALLILPPVLRYLTNELALTNKRVVARFGIFSISTLEMRLEKIESVSVNQSLFGRIFGYGSIVVRGTGGSHDVLPNIPNPINFRTRFASALSAENLD